MHPKVTKFNKVYHACTPLAEILHKCQAEATLLQRFYNKCTPHYTALLKCTKAEVRVA
jgi:hypothetical protein